MSLGMRGWADKGGPGVPASGAPTLQCALSSLQCAVQCVMCSAHEGCCLRQAAATLADVRNRLHGAAWATLPTVHCLLHTILQCVFLTAHYTAHLDM